MIGYRTVRELAELGISCLQDSIEDAERVWEGMGLPEDKLHESDGYVAVKRKLEHGQAALEVLDESIQEIEEAIGRYPKIGYKKIFEIIKANIENDG
jgi:hypothetical protein